MREIIADIVKQASGLVDIIKVIGTAESTRLEALDQEKTLIIVGKLKTPVKELEGVFGLTNLGLLKGLLDFSSYKTDKASFSVKRGTIGGESVPEQFEFKDGAGAGSTFRLMAGALCPDQAAIANVPWDVSVQPSRAKIAEFQQLASLYNEVDKHFGAKTEDGNLLFTIGDDNSSMHRASAVVAEDVKGELRGGMQYSTHHFMSVMRIAGNNPTVRLTTRGVLCVEVESTHGNWTYYVRAKR